MAKAKRGQTVQHNRSGKIGVIQSVVGGVANVIFRDGSKGMVHTTQVSKAGGCLVIAAVPVLTLIAGAMAYGSQAT